MTLENIYHNLSNFGSVADLVSALNAEYSNEIPTAVTGFIYLVAQQEFWKVGVILPDEGLLIGYLFGYWPELRQVRFAHSTHGVRVDFALSEDQVVRWQMC